LGCIPVYSRDGGSPEAIMAVTESHAKGGRERCPDACPDVQGVLERGHVGRIILLEHGHAVVSILGCTQALR